MLYPLHYEDGNYAEKIKADIVTTDKHGKTHSIMSFENPQTMQFYYTFVPMLFSTPDIHFVIIKTNYTILHIIKK